MIFAFFPDTLSLSSFSNLLSPLLLHLFLHLWPARDGRVLAAPSLEGPQIDLRSSVVNNTKQATHSSSKMHPRRASPSPLRKASRTSSSLSLMSANDVSEMMFPPFLTNDPHGSKPELIEHSFRLQRLSDRSSLYNLKIKWYENQPTKAEFSHELKMSLKDIHKSHSTRSSSMPVKSSRVPKPEPEYISIHGADVEAEKSCKVVARAIAQVRRDGNIVRMLFRDDHTPNTTLRDVVNTVIRQLDAEGTTPDVYVLSDNHILAHKNTTLRFDSLPEWRLVDMVDPSKELHVAVDFSKRK